MTAFIDNQTPLPTRRVRAVARWVLRELDVDLPSILMRVTPSKHLTHHGRFVVHARAQWPDLWAASPTPGSKKPKIPGSASHLMVVHVPLATKLRVHDRGFKTGPPPIDPQNWIESLICITAHEAMHVRQFLFRRPGAPKWSEVQAEWAEYRLLKRWRKELNP